MNSSKSCILDAIAALEQGDRRRASVLIHQELKSGPQTGERWASVSRLADRIGEIDMAIDASYRAAITQPIRLNRLLTHCGLLAQVGRSEEALELIGRLPVSAQKHPACLHFRGTIASEEGDFERAESTLREALAAESNAPQVWFALAMLKTFELGDPDFDSLSAVEADIGRFDALTQSRYYYAMGKALVDMDDIPRAFSYYEAGAAIRRREEPYDNGSEERHALDLIEGFTLENLKTLTPSRFTEQRALFVNGLPRSGTTLVESILTSHTKVSDGAEINLFHPATLPAMDRTFAGALAYQARSSDDDPFGKLASDYHRMLAMRFRTPGLVIDKTLNQSSLMGLLLHTMPAARVLWLRRRPEDVALSAYRSFFTSSVPWSWSMEDIARHMRTEDRLYAHWQAVFPERILTVPYEDLVQAPDDWIRLILAHFGLRNEPQVSRFHENKRKVRTASVKQVRAPISTDAVGKADRFAAQIEPFRRVYYR